MNDDMDLILEELGYALVNLHRIKQRMYFRRYYKRKKDNLVVKRKRPRKPKRIRFSHSPIVVDFT